MGASAFATAVAELNDYAAATGAQRDRRDSRRRVRVRRLDGRRRRRYERRADTRARSRGRRSTALPISRGTGAQVRGNINCPLSVTAAAVLYVLRCLMPVHTPAVERRVSLCPHRCAARQSRRCATSGGGGGRQRRNVDANRRRAAGCAGKGIARSDSRGESGHDEQRCDGASLGDVAMGLLRNHRRRHRARIRAAPAYRRCIRT